MHASSSEWVLRGILTGGALESGVERRGFLFLILEKELNIMFLRSSWNFTQKILLLGSLPKKGLNNYCAPSWRHELPFELGESSIWFRYLLREILSCVNYWGIRDI
jgi:hypothetical protein